MQVQAPVPGEKSSGTTVLLNFLFTGAGSIYLGETERGIVQIVIYLVLAALSAATGIFFIFLVPYWIWGMFDASSKTDEYNNKLREAIANERNEKLTTTSSEDFAGQLDKLFKLHSVGLLDGEEFASKKKELILSLIDKKPRQSVEDFLAALIPSVEKGSVSPDEIGQIKKLVL